MNCIMPYHAKPPSDLHAMSISGSHDLQLCRYLCNRIIDVDGRCLKVPLFEHLVEVVDTSGRLLSDTLDACRSRTSQTCTFNSPT